MKLKTLIIGCSMLFSSLAYADNYLCSYTTQISEHNKRNSSGVWLAKGYNKQSVAAILRQDRADYYQFNVRDDYDTADCVMHSKQQRAVFEKLLNNSKISNEFIRAVVDGYPVIDIDLYQNHIEARMRAFN